MQRSIAAAGAVLMLTACGAKPKVEEPAPEPIETVDDELVDVETPGEDEDPVENAEPEEKAPIALPNARVVGDLLVGGQPTIEQIDQANELGYKSIMSVQSSDEEGARALGPHTASLEMRYVRFAISEDKDLTEAKAWEFAATLGTLEPPIIVHDATGRRVGAMLALKAFFVDGLSAEEAYEVGEKAGMSDLAPTVKKLIAANEQ